MIFRIIIDGDSAIVCGCPHRAYWGTDIRKELEGADFVAFRMLKKRRGYADGWISKAAFFVNWLQTERGWSIYGALYEGGDMNVGPSELKDYSYTE
jgi:hypothetical protein